MLDGAEAVHRKLVDFDLAEPGLAAEYEEKLAVVTENVLVASAQLALARTELAPWLSLSPSPGDGGPR